MIYKPDSLEDALRSSVEHWRRMIDWAQLHASRCSPKELPLMDTMRFAIFEDWSGSCCPLCQYCTLCLDCPMGNLGEGCRGCNDDDSIYAEVCRSTTWTQWITAANVVHDTLVELLAEEERR